MDWQKLFPPKAMNQFRRSYDSKFRSWNHRDDILNSEHGTCDPSRTYTENPEKNKQKFMFHWTEYRCKKDVEMLVWTMTLMYGI